MDDFVGTARVLIAVGFALMLVMLRLDAERFGTAEYYETTRDGERPSPTPTPGSERHRHKPENTRPC